MIHKINHSLAKTKNMSSRRVVLTICLLIFSLFIAQCSDVVDAVTDSISQGQEITSSDTIVSAGNIFELGFFSAGNSANHYVGIWYKKISERTIVWVANRDQPLTSTSPKLTINNAGNLMIMDGRITYSVSENVSSHNTSAILLDSGNFVLRNGNFDVLWQSFDYPADTVLPGMKIGYNRKTGKVWSATSWKDAEDADRGDAEMKMDPKQNELLLMMGSQMLWSTGVWHEDYFSLVPEMRSGIYFNFSFYSDENEKYFTFFGRDTAVPTRLLIDVSGQLKELSWVESEQSWATFWAQPRSGCEIYAYCGPFSSCISNTEPLCQCLQGFVPSGNWKQQYPSGGCVRRVALQCEDDSSINSTDSFLRVDDLNFHSSPKNSAVLAADECKSTCLNNCSCTAYTYNGTGVCSLWYGELLNLEQLSKGNPNGGTMYLKLAASEVQNMGGNKRLLWIIVVAPAVLLPAMYIFCQWRRKLKQKDQRGPTQDMLLFDINMNIRTSASELSDGDKSGNSKNKDAWLPLFSFTSVSAATGNFSTENKLGQGGFGPVYKGKLLNGQEVAVKRLSRQSGQGVEELKNETILIAKLQHRNLVRLLGCCMEEGENILIYEYMANKSLDTFLFDPTKNSLLDWGTRVRIIEGIAQGMLYLHQYSRLRIIHRDLKASNILLDNNMNPKISDFGMARIFGGDELEANTKRIVGTYGYMSPEYALEGLFSTKSDVFSFGVLLLEIVSGKKNTGFYHTDSLNLLGRAWDLWKDDRAGDLMDPILENEASYPTLKRYINVALLCVQENAADRPTMSEVVSMLTNELVALPSPKQPAFSYVRSMQNSNPPKSRPEALSLNNVTISLIEAR